MKAHLLSCSSRIASLLLIVASAQLAEADQVDRHVEELLKKNNIPGLALAVVREGKLEKAEGYGFADLELKVPVTERSVFQWASVTKQFTAAAILILAQEGKLKLEDPISRYYAQAPAAWSNVTVRHLVTHTSGIRSYTSLPDFFDTVRKDYTADELIGLVRDLPLEFGPGERWQYSNSGYYLLGLIIEKASGRSYAEFLAARIFEPLGMETARLNHQFELIPNRATGYEVRSNGITRAEFVSPTQPFSAGALVGTVLDLAKWDAALRTEKILPASILREAWTPMKLNNGKSTAYGYGWQTGRKQAHSWVGHGGGIHGFSSFILRLMDDKLTVIVLLNSGYNPQAIATSIASQYIPSLTFSGLKAQPDADAKLSERLRQVLTDLVETKDSPTLTPEFRLNFSQSRRRHAALKNDLQGLESFTFVVEEKPEENDASSDGEVIARLRSYKMVTAEGTRYYTFALTADNKVAQVRASND